MYQINMYQMYQINIHLKLTRLLYVNYISTFLKEATKKEKLWKHCSNS